MRTKPQGRIIMPRYRGTTMPRPKKKKVETTVVESFPEPEADEVPPPPSPPRPARKMVKPESPCKTVLYRAQKEARAVARRELAAAQRDVTSMQQQCAVAGRVMDAKFRRAQTAADRKKPGKPLSPVLALNRMHKAELEYRAAHEKVVGACLLAAEADATVLRAQMAVKDAKIARLIRQLRVARRARRKRRGWSTTRVRFMI